MCRSSNWLQPEHVARSTFNNARTTFLSCYLSWCTRWLHLRHRLRNHWNDAIQMKVLSSNLYTIIIAEKTQGFSCSNYCTIYWSPHFTPHIGPALRLEQGGSIMWVEFVVGSLLCSEKFFSGYSGFPLSSKTNISKFQFDPDAGPPWKPLRWEKLPG